MHRGSKDASGNPHCRERSKLAYDDKGALREGGASGNGVGNPHCRERSKLDDELQRQGSVEQVVAASREG